MSNNLILNFLKKILPPFLLDFFLNILIYIKFYILLNDKVFAKNKLLKKTTKNKAGVLLATGPSIKYQNLKKLKNFDCFSLSNFFTKPALNPDGTPITLPKRNFVDDAAFLLGPGKFLKAGGGGLNILRQAGKFPLSGSGKELVEKVPFLSNQYFKQVARPYLSGMKETLSGAGGKLKDYGIIGALGLGGTGYGLKKGYDAFMSEDEDPNLEKIKKDEFEQEQRDALEKILDDQLSNKKEKVKDSIGGKDAIKENTKEYAEILGGDKARGKDVTDMLLSFAGKALKDDATVKSAFGEFAEEEAKRPGRKEKIDPIVNEVPSREANQRGRTI